MLILVVGIMCLTMRCVLKFLDSGDGEIETHGDRFGQVASQQGMLTDSQSDFYIYSEIYFDKRESITAFSRVGLSAPYTFSYV